MNASSPRRWSWATNALSVLLLRKHSAQPEVASRAIKGNPNASSPFQGLDPDRFRLLSDREGTRKQEVYGLFFRSGYSAHYPRRGATLHEDCN